MRRALALLLLTILAVSCGPTIANPWPTYTLHPTYTPYLTNTPVPPTQISLSSHAASSPTATASVKAAPIAYPFTLTSTPTPLADRTAEGRVVARVTQVIDGDTIKVEISGRLYRLRYIGIDCPEINDPGEAIALLAAEAAAKNAELIGGKIVELEKDVSETDQYGRLLRYVWIGDMMVNAELVRTGYAQASTYPPDVKYQHLFLRLQQEAKEAKRGLWADLQPTFTPSIVPAKPTATIAPP